MSGRKCIVAAGLLAGALGVAGCLSDPEIDEGLAPEPTAVLSGDALVLVPLAEAHPVVLLLYAIDPATGHPAATPTNVTVIPASELEESDDGGNTVRSGRFTFPLVPPGYYVVQGLVDVDENFNILVPQLAAPTAADLLGAHVDPTTGAYIVLELEAGDVAGETNVIFATPPSGEGG